MLSKKQRKLYKKMEKRFSIILDKCIKNFSFENHIQAREFLSILSIYRTKEIYPLTEETCKHTDEEKFEQLNKVLDIMEAEIEAYGEKLN